MQFYKKMDPLVFSKILGELVLVNNRVSLPGLGSFIAENVPAQIVDKGRTILPPERKIYFRTSESWNDTLLEKKYAEYSGISAEASAGKVSDFMCMVRKELNTSGVYRIQGVGELRSTSEGTIFFRAEADAVFSPDSYGLEPVTVKLISREVLVRESADDASGNNAGKASDGPDVDAGHVADGKPAARFFKVFAILAVIILAALLIYAFRDELFSFVRSMFYSGEELDLIKKYNL